MWNYSVNFIRQTFVQMKLLSPLNPILKIIQNILNVLPQTLPTTSYILSEYMKRSQ